MNNSLKDKEKAAIERLKAFAPKDGDKYFGCISGGKDSDCIRILLELANVPYELHHNHTTMDAPETVYYIRSIPNVHIDYVFYDDGSPKTIWNLIPRKKLPPTRLMRYCCSEFKERGGKGRLKVTGIRWDESTNRKNNSDVVKIIGKEKTTQRLLQENGLNFILTNHGGVVMNLDNETARDQADFLHHCYRDRSVTINPIIDWTTADVWEFLHHYGCEGNPLYQCGEDRIGCVGCPLSGTRQQERDFAKYPKFRANYVRAFQKMLEVRKAEGRVDRCNWSDGESVMRWWLQDDTIDGQLSFFDEDEVLDVLEEMR